MNAFELADLAALVSVHGRQLAAADPNTVDRSLAAYWKASRCRLDRWGYSLRSLTTTADVQSWPPNAAGILEEILVSQILSRTIAAIAVAHDHRREKSEFGPIGRNILTGQIDARRRALALVAALPLPPGEGWGEGIRSPHSRLSPCSLPKVDGSEFHAQTIFALDRQSSRWSDLLLAYLSPHAGTRRGGSVDEFAVSPRRVHDFAYDARQHLQSAVSADMAVTMILAGMRSSLRRRGDSSGRTPNADLNLEIATAVIGWFEPALFDSFGLLRSEWLARLRSVSSESLAILDQWWQPPAVVSATPPAARWRR